MIGHRATLHAVPANTEVQLVVPKTGFFVKLADGMILDANGSVFDSREFFLT